MKTILVESDFKDPIEIRKAQQDQIKSCYIEKAEQEEEQKDDFKHHKLMAGYHAVKAAEYNEEALKLSSSSNAELHEVAKQKKGEAARHTKSTEEHREKAKGLYDKEKHGEWNETIPEKGDALKYGSKKAKEADKEGENLIEKEEDVKDQEKKEVKKSEEVEIEKGGEGSKGGKVIAHTKSGKPVYSHNGTNEKYKDYRHTEHREAMDIHLERAGDLRTGAKVAPNQATKHRMLDQSETHVQFAREHLKEAHKKEIHELLHGDPEYKKKYLKKSEEEELELEALSKFYKPYTDTIKEALKNKKDINKSFEVLGIDIEK